VGLYKPNQNRRAARMRPNTAAHSPGSRGPPVPRVCCKLHRGAENGKGQTNQQQQHRRGWGFSGGSSSRLVFASPSRNQVAGAVFPFCAAVSFCSMCEYRQHQHQKYRVNPGSWVNPVFLAISLPLHSPITCHGVSSVPVQQVCGWVNLQVCTFINAQCHQLTS
jgi:hypothetical protein